MPITGEASVPKEYFTQFTLYLDALTAGGLVIDRWDGSEHPAVWRFYDPAGELVARCVPSIQRQSEVDAQPV